MQCDIENWYSTLNCICVIEATPKKDTSDTFWFVKCPSIFITFFIKTNNFM